MKKIEISNWSRKPLFDFFSGMSQPFYSVTLTLDVTALRRFTHEHGLSFYYSLVYLCTQALNRVEAFRYTLSGGELFLLDERIPSFTDLHPGAEHFHIVTLPCWGSLPQFCRQAREKSRAQTTLLEQSEETGDLIYFSCLPWFDATAITNERDFDPDDAIPRIAWGRYTEREGRTELHLSLELNHRFVDGLHIGRFYQELTGLMAALEGDEHHGH